MKHPWITVCATLAFLAGTSAVAATKTVTVTPDQVKWADNKSLPPGWQSAVMAGDPAKKGSNAVPKKTPPNSTFPAHKHPELATITVISASFGVGQGHSCDKTNRQNT